MSRHRQLMSPNAIARENVIQSKCEIRFHGFTNIPYNSEQHTSDVTASWVHRIYDMYVDIIKKTSFVEMKTEENESTYVSFGLEYNIEYNTTIANNEPKTMVVTYTHVSEVTPYKTALEYEELKQAALYRFARHTVLELIDNGYLAIYHAIITNDVTIEKVCFNMKDLLVPIKDIHTMGECVADVWYDSIVE